MSISKHEVYKEGNVRSAFEALNNSNDPLCPHTLARIFPEYRLFEEYNSSLIWVNPKSRANFDALGGKVRWLIADLSGSPAGGKDTIREILEKDLLKGKMRKTISATTRLPRKNEKDKVDYYFVDQGTFDELNRKGELIAVAHHDPSPRDPSGSSYGMPIESIKSAFEEQIRIVANHIDLWGQEDLREKVALFFKDDPPLVVSFFVIPQLPFRVYTQEWLPRFRPNAERERTERAVREFMIAAKLSDVLVVNPIDETKPGIDASQAVYGFINNLLCTV